MDYAHFLLENTLLILHICWII